MNGLGDDFSREKLRSAFLTRSSFRKAEVEGLPSDASFRRYFRLTDGNRHAMLMDAPPQCEDIRPFVEIARHLHSLGLSAPSLMDHDEELGFLILEDFGDDTYTKLLASGECEETLYALAIDTLCTLHCSDQAPKISIPSYDVDALIEEADLFVDWYLPYMTGNEVGETAKKRFKDAWYQIVTDLPQSEHTLVLRDFHVDNLMRLRGRAGVAACGLLDFQDALIGPAAYDVASLLEDARRDISSDLSTSMLDRYRSGMDLSEQDYNLFMQWYTVLAAQRHCKVLGIFVRLLMRDGKGIYIEHLPRVLGLLKAHLDRDELAPLKQWISNEFPQLLKQS